MKTGTGRMHSQACLNEGITVCDVPNELNETMKYNL